MSGNLGGRSSKLLVILVVVCCVASACTSDDRGDSSGSASTESAIGLGKGNEAPAADELAHGSPIVFGTGNDSELEFFGPNGSTHFTVGQYEFVPSAVVTTDAAIAIVFPVADMVKLVDDRGNVIASVPCAGCYSLTSDGHGGVWTVSADEKSVDGTLRHYDRGLALVLDVPILHVADGNEASPNPDGTSPDVVYSDSERIVVQNVASNGVTRGGPFNLATLTLDGNRTGVAQTHLRVASAVPNDDNTLVALTTTGSGGACSVINDVEFLDPRSSAITKTVDLTAAVLGPQTDDDYTSIIANRGQWVGGLYLAHVASLNGTTECGADRGWVLVDPETGSVRLTSSADVAAALNLSASPEWVVSYDGSCDRLVYGRQDGAIAFVSGGREYDILPKGNLLAGGKPLPASCFAALNNGSSG